MPESLQSFFSMGGYGAFVWSAYAITFLVLAANLVITKMNHKRLITRLQRERTIDSAATHVGRATATAGVDSHSSQPGGAA